MSEQVLVSPKATSSFLSNVNLGKVCTLMVIYASFYYPIGAFFIIQLGVPSTPVNVGFRALAALTSVFLIFAYMSNKYFKLKLNYTLWLLLIWWLYYGGRILFDLSRGVRFADYGNEFVYGITFGNIVFPLVAVILWKDYLDFKLFVKWSYWIIAIGSILITISLLRQAEGDYSQLFNFRLEIVNNKGSSQQKSVLNAILVGFYGELVILLSLLNIFHSKKVLFNVVYVLLISLGALLLLFGASRGPFLSCIFLCALLIGSRIYTSKSKIVKLLKFSVISIISVLLLKISILKNVSYEDFAMLRRITSFVEARQKNKTEARDINIASAWQDFLDSPIFGKQFVGTLDGYYPHNVIVEVFMATGIIGALMFFPLLIKSLGRALKFLNSRDKNKMYLALIFLPCLLFLMTSGSLFQGVELWLMTGVLLSVDIRHFILEK